MNNNIQSNNQGNIYNQNQIIQYTYDNEGMNVVEASSYNIPFINRLLNPSTIIGLIAATSLIIGLCVSIIDFSAFHENIDIQYNFGKVCENVALISPVWAGIPYGIIIGIVMLIILSFINIPVLKIIPTILIVVMFAYVMVDVSNVVDWCRDFVHSFMDASSMKVEFSTVLSAISAGAYFLVVGVIMAIVSCFLPGAKPKKVN